MQLCHSREGLSYTVYVVFTYFAMFCKQPHFSNCLDINVASHLIVILGRGEGSQTFLKKGGRAIGYIAESGCVVVVDNP